MFIFVLIEKIREVENKLSHYLERDTSLNKLELVANQREDYEDEEEEDYDNYSNEQLNLKHMNNSNSNNNNNKSFRNFIEIENKSESNFSFLIACFSII